ncbi:MAG: PDZ domain-containing protein [Bacteroidota bacterium]|nr:PDZ domain-containing protein [Bacteroidota bacterium]
MKHASLLIALCVLLCIPAFAQSTTTVEKNATRITITTKKVDESGKTITETYIAEGNEPGKILQQMAVNPEIIQKVEFINEQEPPEAERLFIIRSAGDNMVIEGKLDANAPSINEDKNINRVIINQNEIGKERTYYRSSHGGDDRKINCAALGVYSNTDENMGGCRINSLIDQGGAQDAGLKPGDVITRINEYDIVDFETLHEALSNFRSGDVVSIRYIREDKNMKARVELKDWAQLPGHEWRARTDCGQPIVSEETEETRSDDPNGLATANSLKLEDVKMFPNPTDGAFALSFTLEPGPLTVAITDINGKVVYNENSDNVTGTYTRDIDLKGIPQGNYILTVTQGDKFYTDQISKQ